VIPSAVAGRPDKDRSFTTATLKNNRNNFKNKNPIAPSAWERERNVAN
jgi:hypothetical protein